MRLLKLFVPIFLSIVLIVLDARFSYLDNFKRFTLTLLSPIYIIVDLPKKFGVKALINSKGIKILLIQGSKQILKTITKFLTMKISTLYSILMHKIK